MRKLIENCPKCLEADLDIGQAKNSRGNVIYPWYCVECGHVLPRYAKKSVAEARGSLPRVFTHTEQRIASGEIDPTIFLKACEACGTVTHCENHHWAPRHLFGDEAESWPQSALCRPCHIRWHQIVTPNMSRKAAA